LNVAVHQPTGPGDLRLEELYSEHAPALLRLCTRRLGDRSRAEDACQEALVRAHQAADRFRPGAPVWPWLATIAVNVCTDMERSDSRVAFVAQPPERPTLLDTAAEADGRGRRRLVLDALRTLPVPYRRAVFLHHYAGLTYDEIADHEGTSSGAIRSRLLRARRLLRVRIQELATARGEWPLPAVAPVTWLRDRAAGARIVASRSDAAIGQQAGTAAQYVAALLFAVGVTIGSSGHSVPQAPAPTAIAARAGAHDVRVSLASAALTHAVPADAGRVSAGAPAVPPVPPVHPDFIKDQSIPSPVSVNGSNTPLVIFGWSCPGPGRNEPGPVTKKLCETFPNGITP
jgi:RNA polymerase sigma-70 factor (ECF subfamily)